MYRASKLALVLCAAVLGAGVADTIVVSRAVRMHVQSIGPFGYATTEPDIWRVDVTVRSRRPDRRLVVALSDSAAALSKPPAAAVQGQLRPRQGPRAPMGPTAWFDTLGCRFYALRAIPSQPVRKDPGGFQKLYAAIYADSASLQKLSWLAVFDSEGVRVMTSRLEVQP